MLGAIAASLVLVARLSGGRRRQLRAGQDPGPVQAPRLDAIPKACRRSSSSSRSRRSTAPPASSASLARRWPGPWRPRESAKNSPSATTSTTPNWRGRSAPACCGRSSDAEEAGALFGPLGCAARAGDPLDPARPGDRTGPQRRLDLQRRRLDRRPRRRRPRPARRIPALSAPLRMRGRLFLELEALALTFQRMPAQSSSGVVSRAPASFTIVPRRGSRPPRSSSEISVRCSSQRKPSSSWEICLLWRARRRLTAKRSRGSIARGSSVPDDKDSTDKTFHKVETPVGSVAGRAPDPEHASGCSGSRAQSAQRGILFRSRPRPARG